MDKRIGGEHADTDVAFELVAETNAEISELELCLVGGGIGDTVL